MWLLLGFEGKARSCCTSDLHQQIGGVGLAWAKSTASCWSSQRCGSRDSTHSDEVATSLLLLLLLSKLCLHELCRRLQIVRAHASTTAAAVAATGTQCCGCPPACCIMRR